MDMKRERFEGTPVFESYPESTQVVKRLKRLRRWRAFCTVSFWIFMVAGSIGWLTMEAWSGIQPSSKPASMAYVGFVVLPGLAFGIGWLSSEAKLSTLVGTVTNHMFQLRTRLGMEEDQFYGSSRSVLLAMGSILLNQKIDFWKTLSTQVDGHSFESHPPELGEVFKNAADRTLDHLHSEIGGLQFSLNHFNLQSLGSGSWE